MVILFLLRILGGYCNFAVTGRFPERFLNLASKNGVALWNTKGENGCISASARLSDMKLVISLAAKSGNEISVCTEHGLPAIARRYKSRTGLLAGLVLGSVFCVFMSGYIWNIDVNCPIRLSEYEIRNELRELGLFEGARYDYDTVSRIERNMLIRDGRISWLSINVDGTNAVVEISPKTEIDSVSKKDKTKTVSNLLAAADGKIVKLSVRSGQAVVQAGEGVRQGQLLVSGINALTDGSSELSDSDAEVIAETSHCMNFFLPKSSTGQSAGRLISEKTSASIFGLTVPLSLSTAPQGDCFYSRTYQKLQLLGFPLPVYVTHERYYEKNSSDLAADAAKAGEILKKRAAIYRFFLEGQKFTTVESESEEFRETDDGYTLTVTYQTTENIAKKSVIEIRSE